MDKINRIVLNVIFCIQILLTFLLFVENRIDLPLWLQVAGRLHPLVLHLPIGFIIFLLIIFLIQRELDKTSVHQIIYTGLLLTSLFASITALFGFFLSLQNDYGANALTLHKVSGVALSWFCYVALIWNKQGWKRAVFFGLCIATFITLFLAGHTGAVLTHGENFIWAPISSSTQLTVDNASVYQFAVQPILEKKCFSCHNESKTKGGLVMTSMEKFKAGGENGKPWVEGKPEESRMIKAFYLPLDHDEHMPPDGKPQLTAIEIATLEAWIKSGADFEKKFNQFEEGDSLKFIVASFAASQVDTMVEKQYGFTAAADDMVEDLNTPFRSVYPLYQNSPALQADFFLKESFQAKALEELKSIKEQLVILNLSKMPVTDKDLDVISTFKNLEILNLNFTKIEGSRLRSLEPLKNLQSLSLSGTSVKTTDLEAILKMPNLREVFIWNTKINEHDQKALSEKYPDVTFVGDLFSDNSILRLSKPRLENEGVIRKDEPITIKHNMPGVTIRFSANGAEPDSVAGEIYKEPFKVDETKILKAKACKDSWYCSEVYEVVCFVEGIKPDRVSLESTPDPEYPGEGAKSLTDLRKGIADVFKEPSWLGYKDRPFAAVFNFSKPPSAKKVVISYGKNIGGYIFPPEEVEVWAGSDINQLVLLKKMKVKQPTENSPLKVEVLTIPLEVEKSYPLYKVIAKPVSKLPAWHNGKGKKGWFFIDEIFFY